MDIVLDRTLCCKWYNSNANLVQSGGIIGLNQEIGKLGVELVSKMTGTRDLKSFSPLSLHGPHSVNWLILQNG